LSTIIHKGEGVGAEANLHGVWGGALFLVHDAEHLRRRHSRALVAKGLIIVAVITAAGGEKRAR
jgi:hypothetical protein